MNKYLSIATLLVATNVYAAGSCVICPYGYTCAGGTAAPVQSTPPSTTAPIGSIVYMAYGSEDEPCPAGYLHANGQILQRTNYQALFAVLGTTYGTDPENVSITFKLPDLQGAFIRGIGGNAAALGTKQDSDNKSHTHTFTGSSETTSTASLTGTISSTYGTGVFSASSSNSTGFAASPPNYVYPVDFDGSHSHTFTAAGTISATGNASETRPINYAMYACIKY